MGKPTHWERSGHEGGGRGNREVGHLASEATTPNTILRNVSFVLFAFAFERYGYEDGLVPRNHP